MDSQNHIIFLEKGYSDDSGIEKWLSNNLITLVSFFMVVLLFIGLGGAFYLLRNSEL